MGDSERKRTGITRQTVELDVMLTPFTLLMSHVKYSLWRWGDFVIEVGLESVTTYHNNTRATLLRDHTYEYTEVDYNVFRQQLKATIDEYRATNGNRAAANSFASWVRQQGSGN